MPPLDAPRTDLNIALNESTVAAIHLDIGTATARVLRHVLALAE